MRALEGTISPCIEDFWKIVRSQNDCPHATEQAAGFLIIEQPDTARSIHHAGNSERLDIRR